MTVLNPLWIQSLAKTLPPISTASSRSAPIPTRTVRSFGCWNRAWTVLYVDCYMNWQKLQLLSASS